MQDYALKTLEYDLIIEQLREYAQSGLGKRLVEELRPAVDVRAVSHMLRETTEARAVLDAVGHVPLHGLSDVTDHMSRIGLGAVLEPTALTALCDFFRGCRKLKGFMARFQEIRAADRRVRSIHHGTGGHRGTYQPLHRERPGQQRSQSTPGQGARTDGGSQGPHQGEDDSYLTSAKYRDCLQEAIISVKDGRYCVPVKSSHRHLVDGIVIATSGSGQSVFVEPASVRVLTNELKALSGQEEAEEYQVLSALSGEVALRLDVIQLNIETMAVYDFAFAKAKFSRALQGIPATVTDCPLPGHCTGKTPPVGVWGCPVGFSHRYGVPDPLDHRTEYGREYRDPQDHWAFCADYPVRSPRAGRARYAGGRVRPSTGGHR